MDRSYLLKRLVERNHDLHLYVDRWLLFVPLTDLSEALSIDLEPWA